jgi:3-deoxy-D-manno-octulosonic acid (KDO) 8-phosphate synthase
MSNLHWLLPGALRWLATADVGTLSAIGLQKPQFLDPNKFKSVAQRIKAIHKPDLDRFGCIN